jgi:hypothetical protein
VAIQLAHSAKDGMAKVVLLWLALLAHGSMAQTVFALTQETDVCHGNCGMGITVCTIKTNAHQEQNGIKRNALLTQAATAPTDIIWMALNVFLSLNSVCLPPLGKMTDVFPQLAHAHMELWDQETLANPTLNAQMDNHGILQLSNVSVLKAQDGVAKNALSAQVAKFGTCGMAALAPMDTSWLAQSAKSQTIICVN